MLLNKSKEHVQSFLDERKHLRHVELALQNAAERGARQWHTPEERNCYNNVLRILSEDHSRALRQEAMQLFTLSDDPNLADLIEQYNLSQRITALAHHTTHAEVDVSSYLRSFFEAFLAELYNDTLFREKMSDAIQVRAAMQGTRSLEEIRQTLQNIQGLLADEYTLSDFQREIENYLEYIEQKYRCHRFAGIVMHANEDKAPELEHIFVHPRVTLLPNSAISQEGSAPADLVPLLEKYPYLVLLGGPGSGKSTTTCHLAWLHAKAHQETTDQTAVVPSPSPSPLLSGQPLPLRIELRLLSEARRQNMEYSFLTYAAQVLLGREHVAVSARMFETLLERRALFVLFDGLDEVANLNERRDLVEQIEMFTQRYPGNRVLVTSRPVGYELASITASTFQHAEIHNFDDEQIRQFLESWYRYVLRLSPLPSETHQELELFFTTLKENPRLHKLAVSPLLLTVMTALHRYERLPDERVLIYDKCSDLLLDAWARLKYDGMRWKDIKLGKEDQKACLAHLGFVLHQRAQEPVQEAEENTVVASDTAVDVPASFISRELRSFLAKQNLLTGAEQHAEVERLLEMVRTEAGLIVSRGTGEGGEALYGFVHRTFQEYFAALDVLNRYQQEDDSAIVREFLADYVHDPHWQEVILLLLGKFKHKFTTGQLSFILGGKTRRSTYAEILKQDLFFVCNCLIDGIKVDQSFASDVLEMLCQVAQESPFPTQRREAIRMLIDLRSTRHYAELGKRTLLNLLQTSMDATRRTLIAEALYESLSPDQENQQELWLLLRDFLQHQSSSLDQELQLAKELCEISSYTSERSRKAWLLLCSYLERSDLSFDQQFSLTELLYELPTFSPTEQQKPSKLLYGYLQRTDLSFDQQLSLTKMLYKHNLDFDPFEANNHSTQNKLETLRLLCNFFVRSNLPLDQQFLLIRELCTLTMGKPIEQQELWQFLQSYLPRTEITTEQQIQLIQMLGGMSPLSFDKRQEIWPLLQSYLQCTNIATEQQIQLIQMLYKLYKRESRRIPWNSFVTLEEDVLGFNNHFFKKTNKFNNSIYEEQRKAWWSIHSCLQYTNFSLEQQLQIIQILCEFSYSESIEQQEVRQLIRNYLQSSILPLEEQIQLIQMFGWISKSDPDARHESWQLTRDYLQRADLSSEQRFELIRTFYRISSPASEERQNLWQDIGSCFLQRSDLSTYQQVQFLAILYNDILRLSSGFPEYVEEDLPELQEIWQLIDGYLQRTDIPLDQQFQFTQELYEAQQLGISERKRVWPILWNKLQSSDLTSSQQIHFVELLYNLSSTNSEERKTIWQFIRSCLQNLNFSLEEQLLLVQIPYKSYASNPRERQSAFKFLMSHMAKPTISRKTKIHINILPCTFMHDNFAERLESISMLLTLLPKKSVASLIRKNWEDPFESEEEYLSYIKAEEDERGKSVLFWEENEAQKERSEHYFSPDVDTLIQLVRLDVLPGKAMDNIYQYLKKCIPLLV